MLTAGTGSSDVAVVPGNSLKGNDFVTSSGESLSEEPQNTGRLVAAITWLLGFLAVFYSLDLPNSGSPPVNRRDLWLELPVLLQNCLIQHPDALPSGWRFFPQRMPAILPAILMLAGAVSFGRLVLRILRCRRESRLEQFVLAYGVGMSLTSLLTLGCGLLAQLWSGTMSAPVLGTTLAACVLCEGLWALHGFRTGRRDAVDRSARHNRRVHLPRADWGRVMLRGQIPFGVLARLLVFTVIVLFLAAMALGSLLPSIDFDVKEYHLQGPREYFEAGYISWLPHNVYTSFPFLTEMFALLGMVLTGDYFIGALSGKLMLMTFAPVTGLAVFCAGRRWFDERVAWAGALIHLTAPWTYRISVIAYAEGGLTFYLFTTLLAVLLAGEASGRSRSRLVFLAGLFAGSAMACKYPGVLSVVIPMGAVLLWCEMRGRGEDGQGSRNGRERRRAALRTGILYASGALLAVGPWLVKNLAETGNPVYPLMHSVFGGVDWTPTLEANWKAAHGPPHHHPQDLLVKLFDVTLRSDWLSPLFYALAPLTLLTVRRRRLICGLWCYVGFLFLSWWVFTHRIDRFWVPMIPVVSLIAGAGACWTVRREWRYPASVVAGCCILFNLGFVSTALCGLNTWLGDYARVRPIAESSAPAVAAVNALNLPAEARVLCVGEAQVFDARFDLVYNTVFDVSIFESWCSADQPGRTPADQPMRSEAKIRETLTREGITHVLVNWEEILRYRTTYRYTDFVAPWRFDWLREHGLLETPQPLTGWRPLESFDRAQQAEIAAWGPELIVTRDGRQMVVRAQLYRIRGQ